MLKFAAIIVYLVFIFSVTIIFKKYKSNNKELLRKIIHIGIGPIIPLAIYLDISREFAAYFVCLISILIFLNYQYRIFPIIEDVDRKSYGTFFYSLSLFILIIIFWNKDPITLVTGFFIMTFGDGLAGLIGRSLDSREWLIFNQKKTLLGTLTMLIASFLVISCLGFFAGYGFNIYYLFIAIIATCLEQISFLGVDNLSVPIVSSLCFNFLISKI